MHTFQIVEDRKRLFIQLILEGRCIGTACFVRLKDRSVAELESFVVWNEEDRRQGYGTKVIDEARRILPNHGIKTIFVEGVFPEAFKFYEKYGFQNIGLFDTGPPIRTNFIYSL